MLHLLVVAYLSTMTCIHCQVPGPPGIVKRLRDLEGQKQGFHVVKSALRSTWLPQHNAHNYLDQVDKLDRSNNEEVNHCHVQGNREILCRKCLHSEYMILRGS
jgi:hypothetical protein